MNGSTGRRGRVQKAGAAGTKGSVARCVQRQGVAAGSTQRVREWVGMKMCCVTQGYAESCKMQTSVNMGGRRLGGRKAGGHTVRASCRVPVRDVLHNCWEQR